MYNTLTEVKLDIKSAIQEYDVEVEGGLITYADTIRELPLVDIKTLFPILTSQRAKFGFSGFKTIPEIDTSNYTDMSYMFAYCTSLRKIPMLDTSNVTNMSSMFNGCTSLWSIPQLDTSNVTDMSYMFAYCEDINIPLLDASNVENADGILSGVYQGYCDGFMNIGKNPNFPGFSCGSFSYERHKSVINIFNHLYDRASAGYSTSYIEVSRTVYEIFLTEEKISKVTNKGWVIRVNPFN